MNYSQLTRLASPQRGSRVSFSDTSRRHRVARADTIRPFASGYPNYSSHHPSDYRARFLVPTYKSGKSVSLRCAVSVSRFTNGNGCGKAEMAARNSVRFSLSLSFAIRQKRGKVWEKGEGATAAKKYSRRSEDSRESNYRRRK